MDVFLWALVLLLLACIVSIQSSDGVEHFFQERPSRHGTAEDGEMLRAIQQRLVQVHPAAADMHFFADDKSYTINKKRIYLCLKDLEGVYYDQNMLMYVALHELAHCLCEEVGHTRRFHEVFSVLLHRAHDVGVYDRFVSPIPQYCPTA